MNISDQEVWLRAYCAAITGSLSYCGIASSANIIPRANQAVEDFNKRFPPFQSVSSEKK